MTLPLYVEHEDLPVSADAFVEVDVLREQIHFSSARDTEKFMRLFLMNLQDEKARYMAALAAHNLPGAAEAAGEMNDLTHLAATCRDHLTGVRA